MPVINDIGISEYTKQKEAGLERILSMHLRISSAIIAKGWAHPKYHWFDINAGSGENPDCAGSPVVFLTTAKRQGINYSAVFIEQNEDNVKKLADCIQGDPGCTVLQGDNTSLLPITCGQMNGKRPRFGMIYTDPNGIPPFDMLSGVSHFPQLDRVDILIYVSGTSVKRVKCQTGKCLLDYLASINKKFWLVRDISQTGNRQWTFLLGTNWDSFPEYRKEGFYRTESKEGKEILYILNTTEQERQQAMQPMLIPYGSYQEYLSHPQYRAIRQQAIDRSGGICERCHSRPVTEVHHLSYPKWGTFEKDASGLLAICHQCHCELEGKEN